MAKKLRVFVYGTLKSGRTNHEVLAGNTQVGRATIKGTFDFVNLGWYPAVIEHDKAAEREIGGEVWEIDQDTLATLDMIEGHPSFYERRKVRTSLGFNAWCYFLTPDFGDRPHVTTLFWGQNDEENQWIEASRASA
jgi:gamma-glutamylcyclotransferase (GGCT)/AIG2-like uncharacterized protein YtfP